MCGQCDSNFVVHIEPLWVMIMFFRKDGHFRHESKGLDKIIEFKLPRDGFLFLIELPIFEGGQIACMSSGKVVESSGAFGLGLCRLWRDRQQKESADMQNIRFMKITLTRNTMRVGRHLCSHGSSASHKRI